MKTTHWLAVLACFAVAMVLGMQPVSAKTKNTQDIPDVDGTYDVAGHPKLKVRVFVHYPKKPAPAPDPQPEESVCSINDPDYGPFVNPTGWHLPANWTYNLNPYVLPAGITQTNLNVFSTAALEKWETATGNKVNFVPGAPTKIARKALDGKNIIAWGSAPASALAVTYTWYNTVTKEVVDSDIIMNKKFPWKWTPYSLTACPNSLFYDAQDILTHEMGHWVGLNDEYASNYANNTMYGYGKKGEIIKDTLTSGDSAGAASVY